MSKKAGHLYFDQMCQSKEHMIQSQYLVVDGLKNMTDLQDRLGRAKDMALKILQNTVYQMVDRIPECSNTATQGEPYNLFFRISRIVLFYK